MIHIHRWRLEGRQYIPYSAFWTLEEFSCRCGETKFRTKKVNK